jgi:hypothetical protein
MKITALEYLVLRYKDKKSLVVKNGEKVVQLVVPSADGQYYEVKHTDGTWEPVVMPFTVVLIKPDQSQ